MMMIRHNVPTLALCRALVSIHAQCNDCASALPSASETWLYRRVSGLLIRSGQAQTEEEEEKVEEEERAKKKKNKAQYAMSEWPCTSLHLSCTQTPTLNHTARAHRIHTAGSASRSSDPPTHMVLWMCQYNSGSYHKQFESSRNSCEKQWNTRVRNHEYLLHASSSGSSIRPALLYRQYRTGSLVRGA